MFWKIFKSWILETKKTLNKKTHPCIGVDGVSNDPCLTKGLQVLDNHQKTQAAHPLVAVQSLPDTDFEPIIRWIILRKWSKLAPLTDGRCAKEIPKAYLAGGRVCLTMAEPIRAVYAGLEMLGISWNDIISDHYPNVNLTYPFLVPKKCNCIKFHPPPLTLENFGGG